MREFLKVAAAGMIAVLVCASSAAAEKEPPPDPDLGTDIVHAVAFQD